MDDLQFSETLCEKINPAFYDRKNKDYKDRRVVGNACNKIAEELFTEDLSNPNTPPTSFSLFSNSLPFSSFYSASTANLLLFPSIFFGDKK